ncbi:aminotransferase class I/II-fold pyridoxal phosphate-dependent enzyme [Leisingera sp. HS039]|uniref:pyridoxal phosphate-dependent aminotransferase n=1 Tax=unclassified Leisingera TaxID=2614906 RepID=UPI001070F63C|nr:MULTISPECIES: histidinol-phosphate transaminase [unclassified Leisingera]MBQ4825163.1 aminotransferase class I/II-fold pyridoxal phosphate-dependent enzyme [Leisingera sp. HS039]QBR38692.1 aminotransferase class I/II-fold pyridoxal phosphate-dependent enzyme [Leisingera sp. NJS201]
MIRAVPHVAAMAPYALADLGGEGVISLAQNESAFAASPAAIAAGKAVLGQMPLYPDPEWPDLRAAVAEVHRLDPAKVLCGAGSMELITCLIRAFAGPGDRVLGTDYGYAFVSSASAQVQAEYVKARERALTVSVDDILAAVTPQTRIVFVCNPGNPTGTLIPNAEIQRLRAGLPADVLLVVDQAYAEFADAENNPAEIFALAERGDTVVMRTLSKAYGLAGARAGWGYFPPQIAGEVRKLLNPNNISIPSQAMAAAAMQDQAHMRDTVAKTAAIRDGFAAGCRALGLTVPQSHTNFVLMRFASPVQAQAADAALRAEKLLMRGMGGYGLSDCLRATISSQDVMDRALAVLKGVLT